MVTRTKRPSPVSLSPSPQISPRPSSAFEEFDEVDIMVMTTTMSRPSSVAMTSTTSSPRSASGPTPPTLAEILVDAAPAPWTLTAFMAYLSQNHCMETLEFTLDAQRYSDYYAQLASEEHPSRDCTARLSALWDKLMQFYIFPCSPREINIPARVRDQLLRVPTRPSPPHPSALDDAGRIIFELMNDSLLVPFIESVSQYQQGDHLHRVHDFAESAELTDDSGANSPSSSEPMTPPTTPPMSEWSFANPQGGLHRAMAAHNMGWKRVGAKLGFSRKASRRQNVVSTSSVNDVDMVDGSHYQRNSL